LFLDEFPEFGTRVLEVMRQLMEDKVVTMSRAKGSLTFSANFQLIAAMNPCPCGYYGDSQKPCTCAHTLVTKYQKRISGPLLDRIDIQTERYSNTELSKFVCNADMRVEGIRQFCKLPEEGQSLMRSAMTQLNLSAGAYHRTRSVKLVRTIEDLAGCEEIQTVDLAEALHAAQPAEVDDGINPGRPAVKSWQGQPFIPSRSLRLGCDAKSHTK
jgi:magnesium chelatase family protein